MLDPQLHLAQLRLEGGIRHRRGWNLRVSHALPCCTSTMTIQEPVAHWTVAVMSKPMIFVSQSGTCLKPTGVLLGIPMAVVALAAVSRYWTSSSRSFRFEGRRQRVFDLLVQPVLRRVIRVAARSAAGHLRTALQVEGIPPAV